MYRTKYTIHCLQCGNEFLSRYQSAKYCSPQCVGKARQQRPKKLVTKTCICCGKEFETYACQNKKCCSNECRGASRSVEKSNLYRGGTIKNRGPNWRTQRKRALDRDNHKCQICGKTQRASVHHIKPYREFDGDWFNANQLANLITLCDRCHGKVEHGVIACPVHLI